MLRVRQALDLRRPESPAPPTRNLRRAELPPRPASVCGHTCPASGSAQIADPTCASAGKSGGFVPRLATIRPAPVSLPATRRCRGRSAAATRDGSKGAGRPEPSRPVRHATVVGSRRSNAGGRSGRTSWVPLDRRPPYLEGRFHRRYTRSSLHVLVHAFAGPTWFSISASKVSSRAIPHAGGRSEARGRRATRLPPCRRPGLDCRPPEERPRRCARKNQPPAMGGGWSIRNAGQPEV